MKHICRMKPIDVLFLFVDIRINIKLNIYMNVVADTDTVESVTFLQKL